MSRILFITFIALVLVSSLCLAENSLLQQEDEYISFSYPDYAQLQKTDEAFYDVIYGDFKISVYSFQSSKFLQDISANYEGYYNIWLETLQINTEDIDKQDDFSGNTKKGYGFLETNIEYDNNYAGIMVIYNQDQPRFAMIDYLGKASSKTAIREQKDIVVASLEIGTTQYSKTPAFNKYSVISYLVCSVTLLIIIILLLYQFLSNGFRKFILLNVLIFGGLAISVYQYIMYQTIRNTFSLFLGVGIIIFGVVYGFLNKEKYGQKIFSMKSKFGQWFLKNSVIKSIIFVVIMMGFSYILHSYFIEFFHISLYTLIAFGILFIGVAMFFKKNRNPKVHTKTEHYDSQHNNKEDNLYDYDTSDDEDDGDEDNQNEDYHPRPKYNKSRRKPQHAFFGEEAPRSRRKRKPQHALFGEGSRKAPNMKKILRDQWK